MTGPIRVGGRTVLPDGGTMIWSVAEGRRGRRWRAVTNRDGSTESDLLLETGRDGRPTRLELATSAGLLTLHPEHDGSAMHGNTVTTAGVRHHELPWSVGHILLVERSPLAEAAAVGPLRNRLGVGEGAWFGSITVDGALIPRIGQTLVVHAAGSSFTIAVPADDQERTIAVDEAGLPAGGAMMIWELERA